MFIKYDGCDWINTDKIESIHIKEYQDGWYVIMRTSRNLFETAPYPTEEEAIKFVNKITQGVENV